MVQEVETAASGSGQNEEGRQTVTNITSHRREHLPLSQQAQPKDDPVYDFEHLGLKIAESLVHAAEQQVLEATSLLEETKSLAESIREQVKIQTAALEDLNGRLKRFGGQMLDAHRQFNGGGREKGENPPS